MTTTTDKATPRPWTYHANYIEVSNEHGDHSLYAPDDRGAVSPETRWANARFVVQAVNAHDELVAVLRQVRINLVEAEDGFDIGRVNYLDHTDLPSKVEFKRDLAHIRTSIRIITDALQAQEE